MRICENGIYRDMTEQEIAEIKGMNHGTVRTYYSKGIKKLRDICLKLEEGGNIDE